MNQVFFTGYLRTHRGHITIYWTVHPSAGLIGWMFVDLGLNKYLRSTILLN